MAIKYGYFNANVSTDSEGNPVYDRTYSADTFNKYFEGIISPNGAFVNFGNKCKVSIDTENFEAAWKHTDADGNEGILLNIGTGKVIVNGHWVTIESGTTVLLPLAGASERVDKISIRYRRDMRDCYICVESPNSLKDGVTGHTYNRKEAAFGNTKYPMVIGVGQYYNAANDKVTGFNTNDPALCDVTLAYVFVPKSTDVKYKEKFKIANKVGSNMCPWITQLIQSPDEIRHTAEEYANGYTEIFSSWVKDALEKGELNLKWMRHSKTFFGGTSLPIYISALFPTEEYTYDTKDYVDVYYNGLKLVEGEDKDYYVVRSYLSPSINFNHLSSVPAGNELEVVISEAVITSIPDGDLMAH